jgi:hypothetical protein
MTVRIIDILRTVRSTPRLNPMAKSARKTTSPNIVNRTVPRRPPNSALRTREYLTEKEIERLQEAARKRSRYGHRDATMILVAYRHGLRASSRWLLSNKATPGRKLKSDENGFSEIERNRVRLKHLRTSMRFVGVFILSASRVTAFSHSQDPIQTLLQ